MAENSHVYMLMIIQFHLKLKGCCMCSPPLTYHGNEPANEPEVEQVVRVDTGGWVDL